MLCRKREERGVGSDHDLKKPKIFKKMQCTLLVKLTIHCIS